MARVLLKPWYDAKKPPSDPAGVSHRAREPLALQPAPQLTMPRAGRIVLPGFPHHIVQRGHNRRAVFGCDEDYHFYLANLQTWKNALGCEVYAYCLMTNHVHLVVNPGKNPAALALLMKRIAGRQTRLSNRIEQKTGTLWEGRFKSSPIETDAYLLACCRYVELNPVRAGIVSVPEHYRWSSYPERSGSTPGGWTDGDPCYLGLGADSTERAHRYRQWVTAVIPDGEWNRLRQAVQRGCPAGDESFLEKISGKIGRRVEMRPPGRPRKSLDK